MGGGKGRWELQHRSSSCPCFPLCLEHPCLAPELTPWEQLWHQVFYPATEMCLASPHLCRSWDKGPKNYWGEGRDRKKEKQNIKLGRGISQAHGFQFLTIPDWGVLSPRQVLALVPAGTETAARAPQSPEQPRPFLLSQGLGCSQSLFWVTNASAARSARRQLPRAGAAASQLSPRPVLAHEICCKHSSRTALLLPPLRGLSLQRSGGP